MHLCPHAPTITYIGAAAHFHQNGYASIPMLQKNNTHASALLYLRQPNDDRCPSHESTNDRVGKEVGDPSQLEDSNRRVQAPCQQSHLQLQSSITSNSKALLTNWQQKQQKFDLHMDEIHPTAIAPTALCCSWQVVAVYNHQQTAAKVHMTQGENQAVK